jgi:hypothetical protein
VQLVVADINKTRQQLLDKAVKVSDVVVIGENPSLPPMRSTTSGFVFFDDPDRNSWTVQRISARGM